MAKAPAPETTMTPSEPAQRKPPTVFGRAEAGSRQLMLHVGLGVTSMVVGSMMGAGAATRFAERFPLIENPSVAFAIGWLLQRVWLFVTLPLVGWVVGRLTEVRPLRFALTSALSGELFSVLLLAAIDGFEVLIDAPLETVARIVTFFLGVGIVVLGVRAGQAAAKEAQAEADVIAEQQKAEYAARLEALNGPAATPDPAPAPPAKTE